MADFTQRTVEKATDRFLAIQRIPLFLGQDMPQTIVMKEIIDNFIDVVSERGQKATKTVFRIGPNRIKANDNGLGISTEDIDSDGLNSLWKSCAVMFTGSNYNGVAETIGANGCGLTLANYTSHKFSLINFNGRKVKGYSFTEGYLDGDLENGSSVTENGDFVKNPLTYEEANEKFNPDFERGFLADVTWALTPNKLFEDAPNINWLINYAKLRTAEIAKGEIEVYVYADNDFKKETAHYIWSKDKDSENYLPSWDERVKEAGFTLIKDGPWTFAFNTRAKDDEKAKNMNIDSICQGAPINSRYTHNMSITIQDYNVSVSVPFSMKYFSSDYPNYTDQTKVAVRFPYNPVARAFERSGDVYKFFYREAEKAYMKQVIKDSDSSMFWPCLGNPEEGELIIAEGYSAISGLKSQRDPMTQACIALRGKILNTWNLDMVKAMRSDIVKQMLNAVLMNKYKRVIIATDADEHGLHISSLLIALFYRFTNIISEGRLYIVHTPHYLFKKRGKDTLWSDNAKDCPDGYHVTTLKGLGSMSAEEVEAFIMNAETRDLIQVEDDENAWNMLDEAFTYGGENWILTEE